MSSIIQLTDKQDILGNNSLTSSLTLLLLCIDHWYHVMEHDQIFFSELLLSLCRSSVHLQSFVNTKDLQRKMLAVHCQVWHGIHIWFHIRVLFIRPLNSYFFAHRSLDYFRQSYVNMSLHLLTLKKVDIPLFETTGRVLNIYLYGKYCVYP